MFSGFEFAVADSPREAPQGSFFIDEPAPGVLRCQKVGGADDGQTVLVEYGDDRA
jgi:hypothetical protein